MSGLLLIRSHDTFRRTATTLMFARTQFDPFKWTRLPPISATLKTNDWRRGRGRVWREDERKPKKWKKQRLLRRPKTTVSGPWTLTTSVAVKATVKVTVMTSVAATTVVAVAAVTTVATVAAVAAVAPSRLVAVVPVVALAPCGGIVKKTTKAVLFYQNIVERLTKPDGTTKVVSGSKATDGRLVKKPKRVSVRSHA